ncbi:DUF6035 family protein [Mucilaginibacter sp. UYCu711]|uniref:DUF6035 family protein n=1 Tax=Mucilaginibacter sp. UYCu711 TaxID=3156339 RepID=UPI003D24BA8E
MAYQRSIELAFDRKANVQLDANEIFKIAKAGYEVRRQYNSGELDLYCPECDQGLIVSDSKNDRLHFKHFPNAGYCDLKDGKLSPLESQLYTDVLRSKESDRHKYLKNRMAELLKLTPNVVAKSVIADTRFFFGPTEKRRPDVYCKYAGKEMVFEIQLSQLSQRYILGRHKFYLDKGMYLIWILDNFDVHGQSQMERDIKYLSKSQNFFRLDEKADTDFRLLCTYKSPFVTEERTVISPWQKKSVSLTELKFDQGNCQVYYLHYEYALLAAQRKLNALLEQDREQELKERLEKAQTLAEKKATAVFNKLVFYKKKSYNFYKFDLELDGLNYSALEKFNEKLGLATRRYQGKPLLLHYVATAVSIQESMIAFLLRDQRDINAQGEDGKTVLQEIYLNPALDYKLRLGKYIFMRGYQIADSDKSFLTEAETFLYGLFERLRDKSLVADVLKNSAVFNIIESARLQRIIGPNYKNWISFGVYATGGGNRKFWSYIEPALKHYGLWEIIMAADKKGTFQRKVTELENEKPEQLYVIDEAVKELYPEIFDYSI